jgi:hypothetical protein
MSTDGPQPTQGAPKKKKRRKVGRLFFGIVFLSLVFIFFFFGGPLCAQSDALFSLAPSLGPPTADVLFKAA